MKIILKRSNKFNRDYKKFVKNQPQKADQIVKVLAYFVHNPHHPSLNIEKLGGTRTWSLRIDRGNRIFFMWIDAKTIFLTDIGKHDKYRQI